MPSHLPRTRVVVRGREYCKRFPLDTPQSEIDDWKRYTRADAERDLIPLKPTGHFADDALIYLAAVRAMPTYKERARDIGLWVAEFGDAARTTITPLMIRTVRDRWLSEGPAMRQTWTLDAVTKRKTRTWTLERRPLSASTVNHRLRALENLWTVLDGRPARNPVREVPEVEEEAGPPQAIPVALIVRILAALSDQGQAVKDAHRDSPSKARARLHCMAWIGLPPKQLGAVRRENVDWEAPSVYLPKRRKGRGAKGHRIPLTPNGVTALRLLDAAGAWGPFTMTPVRRAWKLAIAAVQRDCAEEDIEIGDLSTLVPYALRHSHATATLAATGSLPAAQALLSHADPRTTTHYAEAAVPAWLAEAAKKLGRHRGERAPKKGPKMDTGKKRRRKRR